MCKQNMIACELRIKCCVLESCWFFDGSYPQTVNSSPSENCIFALSLFRTSRFISIQVTTRSKSSCRAFFISFGFAPEQYMTVSSAYILMCVFLRSLMCITKSSGPSRDPCGTPYSMGRLGDKFCPNHTRCVRDPR